MDRPNSSVSSKAKDSFSQFWETSFVSKILFIFRKEILFLGLKAKSGLFLKALLNYEHQELMVMN